MAVLAALGAAGPHALVPVPAVAKLLGVLNGTQDGALAAPGISFTLQLQKCDGALAMGLDPFPIWQPIPF